MNRRSYLAASTALLAGCSSLTGTGGDDSADGSNESFQLGEGIRTDGGVSLTVDSITVAGQFEGRQGQFDSRVGEMFVFVHLLAENQGDEPQSLPDPDDFSIVADATQYDSFGNGSRQPSDTVEGDRYTGGDQIRTGVGDEGWLLFQIPRDVSTATLSWFDRAHGEELTWELPLAEKATELPHIEFGGFSLPETATVGESIEVGFELENNGGSEGDLDLLLLVDGVLYDEAEWTVSIPPGERTRRSRSYTAEESGEIVVTVYPFEVSERIHIEEEP